jgi:hypothetical protein
VKLAHLALVAALAALLTLALAAQSSFAETYAESVEATGGLTHFWPMDEPSGSSFADLVGSANASISGGVSLGQPGGLAETSAAAVFNGSSGAAQANLDLSSSNELTVEFWMKWSAFADNDALAMEFTPNFNETPGGFAVDPNDAGGEFSVGVGEGATRNNAYFARPSAEQWHHYDFVINTEGPGETEITPYVDGQAVSYTKIESNTGGGFANSTLYWMSRNASSLFGGGSMQDVALYDSALSPSEIHEHYEVAVGAPVNTEAPTVSGAAKSGQTLTAASGTWSGTPTITYAYQWQRCDHLDEECSDVPDATATTYEPGREDVGSALRVVTTATNGAGSGEAPSQATSVVRPGTKTAGLMDPTQDLLVQPSAFPHDSGELDLSSRTPVFFVQAMPKPMTIGAVSIGDFERAAGCSSDAAVELQVYDYTGAGTLSGGMLLAESLAPAHFGASLAQAQWQLPATELAEGHSYGFFLKADSGACEGSIERNWQHNGAQVNSGQSTCATILGLEDTWRLWHVEGESDACEAVGAPTGFEPALPRGWEELHQSSELFSVTHGGECAPGMGDTEAYYGEGESVCQFPQFTEPGQTVADGWYYGLPWTGSGLDGSPRDLYFRLDPAPPPNGTLQVPPSDVTPFSATIHAVIDPKGRDTKYQLRWTGPSGSKGFLPEHPEDIGSGTSGVTISQQLTELEPSSTYHVYLTLHTPNSPPIDERIGSSVYSGEFTTPAEAASPAATTDAATGVSSTQATIAGAIQPNGSSTHYRFEWSTDSGLSEAAQSTLASAGAGSSEVPVTHELSALSPDTTYYYRVVAINIDGATVEGEIESFNTEVGELRNVELPTVEAPTEGGAVNQGEEVRATRGIWSPRAEGVGDQWERCNELGEECAAIEGATEEGYELAEADVGSTVRIRESVEDAEGVTASAVSLPAKVTGPLSTLVWPLAPPTISGVPSVGQTLIAGDGSWTGESPFSYEYQWERCNGAGEECTSIEGSNADTYEPSGSDVGSTIRLAVVVSTSGSSNSATSDVTAAVTEPSVTATAAPSISGTPSLGQTLTAEPGSWSGVTEPTYTYQWLRCDQAGINCQPVESATDATYELAEADLASTIRVIVTAHETESSGAAVSSAVGVVEDTGPANSEPPTIEGSPNAGEILRAQTGEWVGRELDYSYQWQQCNSGGTACANIANATDASYGVPETDVGHTLRVMVVATNELGSTGESSAATAVIGAEATLTNIAAPSISGTPRLGETLTAAPGGWTGSGSLGYAYQWQRCDRFGGSCIDLVGATSDEYEPVEADVGHALSVLVTATDANGSEQVASPSGQPVPASGGPLLGTPPAISGTAQEGETLSVTTGTFTGSGAPSYAYQWVRCSEDGTECEDIEGANSSTYVPAVLDLGADIRAVVTATTGTGSTVGVSSTAGPISASSLDDVSIPVVSGVARVGETLTSSTGTWTGQGSFTYEYQWQRCDSAGAGCSDIEGATSSSYTVVEADTAKTLRAIVAASGSWGTGRAPSEVTATVVAPLLPPINLSVPSIEGVDVEGQALSAEPGTWEGTSPLTYHFQWRRCNGEAAECESVTGATAASYRLAPADVGKTILVTVTASNSAGEASASSSASASIASTEEPVLVTGPSISGSAQEGGTLTGDVGEWAGPEPITYEFQWESCDRSGEDCTPIEGATEGTYSPTEADLGTTIRLTATATNAHGSVAATSAITATVNPAPPSASSPPSIVGPALVGAKLSVDSSGEVSRETPTLASQWQRCNGSGEECANIGGASAAEYTPVEADLSSTIRVVVTFTNVSGEDMESSGPTEAVHAAGPPIEREAPTISVSSAGGSLYNDWTASEPFAIGGGAIVVASPGGWYGEGPISLTYQWQHCVPGEGCTDIPDATQSTYVTSEEEGSGTLTIKVTASNIHGSAEAEASIPLESAGNPANEVKPWISGSADVASTLTAQPGEWSPVPATYSFQWYRCSPSCSAISGATKREYVVKEPDQPHELEVKVTGVNEHGSASVFSEPTGRVAGPLPAISGEPSISGEAIAGNQLTAEGGSWSEAFALVYEWQLCDSGGEACADIPEASGELHETYETTAAEVGKTIRVIVFARNSVGYTSATSHPTAVLAAPEAPTITSSPTIEGTASVGQPLAATSGSWSGSPTLSYAYHWERCDAAGLDCVEIASGSPHYDLFPADLTSTIRVAVTATNAGGSATAVSLPSSLVTSEDAPSNEVPPSVEGVAEAGELARVDEGTWSGAEPISYGYQWERCDSEGHSCVPIDEATGSSYLTTATDEGHMLRVAETATNSDGQSIVHSASSAIVEPPPAPSNTGAPSIEGSNEAGALLTAQIGAWSGGEANSYGYQWQRCNAEGEECADIEAATEAERPSTLADVGYALRVVVTASSPGGEASADSPPSEPIVAPIAPSNLEAPFVEGAAEVGSELAANPGTWSAAAADSYSYQWLRCDAEGETCSNIASAEGSSYTVTGTDLGHTLRVAVTATNLTGSDSAESTQTSIIVAQSTPVNLLAPKLPFGSNPEYGVVLYPEAGSWSGAPTSTTYQWERCDPLALDPETLEPTCVAIAEATELSYVPQAADVGFELRVAETAINGAGSTSQASEITASTVGYEPEEGGVGYSGAAAVGQTIVADGYFHTNPTLDESAEYEFLRLNGEAAPTELQTGASPDYTVTSEDEGHVIEIRATIHILRSDHEETLETQTETAETPTVLGLIEYTEPPAIVGSYEVGAKLTAEPGSWSASGGEVSEFNYRWQRCDSSGEGCENIAGANEQRYTVSKDDQGSTLRVLVSVGETSASSAPTATIAPRASAPVNTAPPTITGTPANGQRLIGHPGSWSAGAAITYTYQWESCESEAVDCKSVETADEPAYLLTAADVGRYMRLRVSASSEGASARIVSASTATVDSQPAPVSLELPNLTVLGPNDVGAAIETDGGRWQDVSAAELQYQWQRCSAGGTECKDIEGAQEKLYRLTSDDRGDRVRVTVTAANETASVKAISALSNTVLSLARLSEEGGEGEESEEGALNEGAATNHMVYVQDNALFIANSNGEEPVQILTCSQADPNASAESCEFIHPRISPNGQMVTVEEMPQRPEEGPVPYSRIIDLNFDGTGLRLLSTRGREPSWIESGTAVRFEGLDANEVPTIYSVDASASNDADPEPLPSSGGDFQEGEESADGEARVFVTSTPTPPKGSDADIGIEKTETGEEKHLKIKGMNLVSEPTLSQDEQTVVFRGHYRLNALGEKNNGDTHLYAVDVDDPTSVTQLSENFLFDISSPTISADGQRVFAIGAKGLCADIAFRLPPTEEEFRCNSTALLEIPISGGQERVVATGPREVHFWAHAAGYKQVCAKGELVCGTWTSRSTIGAKIYAEAFAEEPNEEVYYTYEDDCTDYVSQLLLNGEMKMLRAFETGKYSWWTKPTNNHYRTLGAKFLGLHPPDSTSWSVAETLYHQMRNTKVAVPVEGKTVPHAGDVVFFHWGFPGAQRIGHVGMIVSGNNNSPSHEAYTQHTRNALTTMAAEYVAIGVYLHNHDHAISASENQRGKHWQWYVLRPVHLGAYVPNE